jgi:hypothetical protein
MLKGSLTTTSLAEVLRLLCASAQSGALRLTAESYEAHIYLSNGQILHAECGAETGIEALRTICSSLQADFAFQGGLRNDGRSLAEYPATALIESIKSAIDLERDIARAMPSADDIPKLSAENVENLDAAPEELQLLILADGTRTVGQLSEETGLPLDYVVQSVARHIVAGALRIPSQTPSPPASPPPAAADQPSVDIQPRFWRGKRIN